MSSCFPSLCTLFDMFFPFVQQGELGETAFQKGDSHKHYYILNPRPTEGPIKSVVCWFVCVSLCLSASQFSIFLRNGSLVFSDFLHNVDN